MLSDDIAIGNYLSVNLASLIYLIYTVVYYIVLYILLCSLQSLQSVQPCRDISSHSKEVTKYECKNNVGFLC